MQIYSFDLVLVKAVAPIKPKTTPICATRKVLRNPDADSIRGILIIGVSNTITVTMVVPIANQAIVR